MAKRIFISYRRSDTQHLAGRLADHLSAVRGVDKVFIDVDGIGPGEDFERKICDAIAVSSICIVLIGDQWLGKLDGKPARIMNPNDFVHMEVHAALHSNSLVVPILVENATMPEAADLPESLRTLPRLNAFEVSHSRFKLDVQTLTDALFGKASKPVPGATGSRSPIMRQLLPSLKGSAFAAIGLLGAAIVHSHITGGLSLNESFGGNAPVWLLIIVSLVLGAFGPRMVQALRER